LFIYFIFYNKNVKSSHYVGLFKQLQKKKTMNVKYLGVTFLLDSIMKIVVCSLYTLTVSPIHITPVLCFRFDLHLQSTWPHCKILQCTDNLMANVIYGTLLKMTRKWLTHERSILHNINLEGHLKSLSRLKVLNYFNVFGKISDYNVHRILRISYIRWLSQFCGSIRIY